jgi:hypothetical protein
VSSNQVQALVVLYRPGKSIPPIDSELKVAFPEDDFPLNSNILMATVIKLSLEVNSANLADCYSISLSTADCLRNFANDLARAYLPALTERNENLRGLMTGIKKVIANEEELVSNKIRSTLTRTTPLWRRRPTSSTCGAGRRNRRLPPKERSERNTSKNATGRSRRGGPICKGWTTKR